MKTYVNDLGRRVSAAPIARCTFAGRSPTGFVLEGEPEADAYIDALAQFFTRTDPPRMAVPKPGDIAFHDVGDETQHGWAWLPKAEFEAEFSAD